MFFYWRVITKIIFMKKLFRLSLFILLLCASLFFISHYLFLLHSTHVLSQRLIHYHDALILWRYACYALIFILWPYFVKCVGHRQEWQAETITYLSNQRLKLLALFVIFEIFFVFNVVGKILGHL